MLLSGTRDREIQDRSCHHPRGSGRSIAKCILRSRKLKLIIIPRKELMGSGRKRDGTILVSGPRRTIF